MSESKGFHHRYRQGSLFPREIAAEAEIYAPIEAVWAVLTDFDRYDEWNPFTPRIRGELRIGTPVEIDVRMAGRDPMIRTEWINRIDPHRRLCWGMHFGHPWLLTANRWQTLHPLPGHATHYSTVDKLSGLLAPLVMRLYGSAIRDGFTSVAQALKTRTEMMHLQTKESW